MTLQKLTLRNKINLKVEKNTFYAKIATCLEKANKQNLLGSVISGDRAFNSFPCIVSFYFFSVFFHAHIIGLTILLKPKERGLNVTRFKF